MHFTDLQHTKYIMKKSPVFLKFWKFQPHSSNQVYSYKKKAHSDDKSETSQQSLQLA